MRLLSLGDVMRMATLALGATVPTLPSFAETAPATVGQSASVDANHAPAVHSPNLWYIDITTRGTQCIVDPGHIRLWRAVADKPVRLRVFGPANAPSTIVEFAPGINVAQVDPAAFPIADGSIMTLSDASSGETIGQIDFAILAAHLDDPQRLAEALKSRGCTAQLALAASAQALR
jgi:hypothetical protein